MKGRRGYLLLFFFLRLHQTTAMSSLTHVLRNLALAHKLPQVIVFDLDNTLWTPELYQLYNKPVANRDIRLFPDALEVLKSLYELQQMPDVSCPLLAIASRAMEDDWAQALFDQFPIVGAGTANAVRMRQLFPRDDLIYIECRSKQWHFREIQSACGGPQNMPFSEMVFFDDDMSLNLREISRLGTLCCHTPRGLTVDLFRETMVQYGSLLSEDKHDTGATGQILTARSLGLTKSGKQK